MNGPLCECMASAVASQKLLAGGNRSRLGCRLSYKVELLIMLFRFRLYDNVSVSDEMTTSLAGILFYVYMCALQLRIYETNINNYINTIRPS